MSKPLAVDRFIQAFRLDYGWECQPNTRITTELTTFAKEREGSTRDILELLVIFKMSKGLRLDIHNSTAIEELP